MNKNKSEILNNVADRLYKLLATNNEKEVARMIYTHKMKENYDLSDFNIHELKDIVENQIEGRISLHSLKPFVRENLARELYTSDIRRSSNFESRRRIMSKNYHHPVLNSSEVKKIFKTYDIKNNMMIHSGDVYFAIIEIAQKLPENFEVPSYGTVSKVVKRDHSGKSDLSFDDFLGVLEELKNN